MQIAEIRKRIAAERKKSDAPDTWPRKNRVAKTGVVCGVLLNGVGIKVS
jgi:hypothetical protein